MAAKRNPGASRPIVLCSDNFPPDIGGTSTLFWNTYSRIADRPVTVLTDESAPGTDGAPIDGEMRIVRRRRTPGSWSLLDRSTRRYYFGRARDMRALAAARGLVAHAGRNLPEGMAALTAKALYRLPYIVWVHGEELVTAESSRELTWLTNRIYRNAALLVANTYYTRHMVTRFGVDASKVLVAHPGVDADLFSPAVDGTEIRRRYAPQGERLILSVGRLQRRKGHDLAIDAVARLVRTHPDVKYLIVGDGEERPALEQRVASHGLGQHVIFAGSVPAEDLPSCYAACDLFLMPNRVDAGDFEGFGIVFVEAAACAKPVIGGTSGGASEAVEDGRTGLLVSGMDVDELEAALKRLLESPELRARLGQAGRARVLREFSWHHTAAVVATAHDMAAGRA